MRNDKWKNKRKRIDPEELGTKPKEHKRSARRAKSRVQNVLKNVDIKDLEEFDYDDSDDLELVD